MMQSEQSSEKSRILIGGRYACLLSKPLLKLGYETVALPDNPDIDERLAAHADLSVFRARENRYYLAQYLKSSEIHKTISYNGSEVMFPDISQGKNYPEDVQLNISVCKNRAILCRKTASGEITEFLESCGTEIIECRQGYAACCTLWAGENAIITSDKGIYFAAAAAGINTLQISQGGILLSGFDYGFIGGAALRLNDGLLAFTGDIEKHPDGNRIKEFISEQGIEYVCLTDGELFDIGGGVILQ